MVSTAELLRRQAELDAKAKALGVPNVGAKPVAKPVIQPLPPLPIPQPVVQPQQAVQQAQAPAQQFGQVSPQQAFQQPQPAQPVAPQAGQAPYQGVSVVDYLNSVGQGSSFSARSQLAKQYGIQNYVGSAQQNTQLLNLLRGGVPGGTPAQPVPEVVEQQAGAVGGGGVTGNEAVTGPRVDIPETGITEGTGAGDPHIGTPEQQVDDVVDQVSTGGSTEDLINQMVNISAEMGLEFPQEAIEALLAPKADSVSELREELETKYELDDIEKRVTERPDQSWGDIYKAVYEDLNLVTLQADIKSAIDELDQIESAFHQEVGNIKENPWISQGTANSRVSKAERKFLDRAKVFQNKLTLLNGLYDRGVDDARYVANKALETWATGHALDEQELELIQNKIQTELTAKLQDRQAKEDEAEAIAFRYTEDEAVASYIQAIESGSMRIESVPSNIRNSVASKVDWGKVSASDSTQTPTSDPSQDPSQDPSRITGGSLTPIQEIREDIGIAVSSGLYGTTYETREDVIDALVPGYPELTKDQIASEVYDVIKDIPKAEIIQAVESLPQVGTAVATSLVESEKKAFEPVVSFFKRLFSK